MGPLRDAQLPGAAVPTEAGRLQALPRLGGPGCQSGLLEEGRGFLLKYFYSTVFSIWKRIKYFLCVSCSYVAFFSFQISWKERLSKNKAGNNVDFLTCISGKGGVG